MKRIKNLYLCLAGTLSLIFACLLLWNPLNNDLIYLILSASTFLICGALYLITFMKDKFAHYRPGWILIAAIVFLLSGIYNFFNLSKDITELIRIHEIIMLILGIDLIATSVQFSHLEIKMWPVFSFAGVVFILVGIVFTYPLINPINNNYISLAISYLLIALLSFMETLMSLKRKVKSKNN